MRLWYRPGSAAMAPHLVLVELGLDYELAEVRFEAPDEADAEYRRLNPWGRVPTLEDGDLVLTEAAAICLHLADRHPEARLVPAVGTVERAETYRWLMYLTNTLQPGFLRFFYPERYADEAGREGVRALEERTLGRHFDWIDGELAGRDWLVGGERTVADLFLFMLTRWGRRLDPPAWGRPALRAHFARVLGRSGRRVLEEQGLELPQLSRRASTQARRGANARRCSASPGGSSGCQASTHVQPACGPDSTPVSPSSRSGGSGKAIRSRAASATGFPPGPSSAARPSRSPSSAPSSCAIRTSRRSRIRSSPWSSAIASSLP